VADPARLISLLRKVMQHLPGATAEDADEDAPLHLFLIVVRGGMRGGEGALRMPRMMPNNEDGEEDDEDAAD